MKRAIAILTLLAACVFMAEAQGLSRLLQGLLKAGQAITISDEQVMGYVGEYIEKSDIENKVLPASDPYSQRLARLTSGITEVDGIPLNFKVYRSDEVNAFACADGSVRVYTGLLDCMNDNEVLGVIGHEIGHVAHRDSKKAFRQALINSAIGDALASTSGKIAALTDSQFGQIANVLAQSSFSKKQESQADDYGYDFLKDHGKNPVAMFQAFQKLEALENANGASGQNVVNNLFSSHPDIRKRIQNMQKRARKDGYIDSQGRIVDRTTTPTRTTVPNTTLQIHY